MQFVIIFLFLFIVELTYFYLASKFNITDNPNHRSSHSKPTIRGGGIIFPIAVLSYAFLNYPSSWWWLIGLLLISLISFLDDIASLPNRVRIIVHLVAVSLLLVSLNIYLLWPVWLILLTYILVIGAINAWNFMDGINGITVFYSLSVILTLWYLNEKLNFVGNDLILILGIAAIIFGFFNGRRQAVCFAGDVGAVSISFVLIFLILSLIMTTNNPIFVLLFAVYGIDSVMTICYRLSRKENIFKAHRSHLYQILANEYQLPHLLVSAIYFFLQLIVDICLIAALVYSVKIQWLIGLSILIILCGIYWISRFMVIKKIHAEI